MKFFSIPALFIFIAIAMGVVLVGGFDFGNFSKPEDTPVVAGQCCESGDGESCKPLTETDKTLTFKGATYGLLKAQVELIEGNLHLKDSGESFNGQPIIINSSESHIASTNGLNSEDASYVNQVNIACNRPDPINTKKDFYFKKKPQDPYMFMRTGQLPSTVAQYCDSIPDDELIFVCKENCATQACSFPLPANIKDISCYGSADTVYDVYFRLSDYTTNGVPEFIKNCEKAPSIKTTKKMVEVTQQPQRQNLQLQTFGFIQEAINPGLSPWCKPAIYLYPEKETKVSVEVSPVGPMIYSIPNYPTNGWNVTANPSGEVLSDNASFDYLYYEAEIPDEKIEKPTSGYVVKKEDVKKTLEDMLPKLGLNKKEKDQFVEYWIKALPQSPYFFIGAISTENLDAIAPLSISPKPSSVIRVTLYFEALESFKTVPNPTLSKIQRKGFTVVEWGGIFKKNKDHPFSCFM